MTSNGMSLWNIRNDKDYVCYKSIGVSEDKCSCKRCREGISRLRDDRREIKSLDKVIKILNLGGELVCEVSTKNLQPHHFNAKIIKKLAIKELRELCTEVTYQTALRDIMLKRGYSGVDIKDNEGAKLIMEGKCVKEGLIKDAKDGIVVIVKNGAVSLNGIGMAFDYVGFLLALITTFRV